MKTCNDPDCISCRTVEFIDYLNDQGLSPGEMMATIVGALQHLFVDSGVEFIEVPADIEIVNDEGTVH